MPKKAPRPLAGLAAGVAATVLAELTRGLEEAAMDAVSRRGANVSRGGGT